ncbi:MAG TPA: Cof-type HAD-IIB family hydrolase [Terriglobales bacterium]|nr:Cof-type HAD-IIB family hydrolase [Terriglobales bacterium]
MTLPVRLIAIDIDGTLLNSEFKIPAANINALRQAHESGVEIILATGRRHTFALPIAEMLGFNVWLITSNGAVTKSMSGELFHRDLLPASTARKVIAHMEPFRPNCVLTFDTDLPGALVLEHADILNASIGRWIEKNAAWIKFVVPLEDALVSDPVQLMYCGTIHRMREAEAHLRQAGVEQEVTVLKTEYPARDLCLYDVLNYGCSKGHAVERWASYRSIPREQVMAIGDNYNDLEMLNFAGVPVVMANAGDEMKSRDFTVTLSNDEAGVAAAVEQVLGIKVLE